MLNLYHTIYINSDISIYNNKFLLPFFEGNLTVNRIKEIRSINISIMLSYILNSFFSKLHRFLYDIMVSEIDGWKRYRLTFGMTHNSK